MYQSLPAFIADPSTPGSILLIGIYDIWFKGRFLTLDGFDCVTLWNKLVLIYTNTKCMVVCVRACVRVHVRVSVSVCVLYSPSMHRALLYAVQLLSLAG